MGITLQEIIFEIGGGIPDGKGWVKSSMTVQAHPGLPSPPSGRKQR